MDTEATPAAPTPDDGNVIPMPGPGPFGEGMGTDAAEAHPEPDGFTVEPETDGIEPPEAPDLVELVEQALRIALGVASVVGRAIADALTGSLGSRRPTTDEPADPSSVALLTGAALGLWFEVGRRTLKTAASLARASRPVWSWTTSPRAVRGPIEAARARLLAADDGWREARPGAERAADAFARALVPGVVRAALDQLDLTEIVRERVDVDALAEDVDIGAIVERIQVDDIVARIDMNQVVERVDVDAIVRRIDVEAVVERIDLDELVDRLDLTAIAIEVIDAVDLPEIIRESSGAMASETVEGLRVQGMNADDVVSKVVDRMLRRREGRNAEAPGGGESRTAPPEPGDGAS